MTASQPTDHGGNVITKSAQGGEQVNELEELAQACGMALGRERRARQTDVALLRDELAALRSRIAVLEGARKAAPLARDTRPLVLAG